MGAQKEANERLHQAVRDGDVDEINHALQDGADTEARDSHGYTALLSAAHRKKSHILKALLEKKADIEATCPDGHTAVILAALNGRIDNIKALIEARANVNAFDNDHDTALMWAARWGEFNIVNALIAAGADVNAASKDGTTALMRAAQYGHLSVVSALLEAGADVSVRACDNSTALSMVNPATEALLTPHHRWEIANSEAVDFSRALNAQLGQKSGYQFESDTQGDFRLSVGAPRACVAMKGREALIRIDLVAVRGDNVTAFAGHVAERIRGAFGEMKGIMVDYNTAQPERAGIILRHPAKGCGRFNVAYLGVALHDWLQDHYESIKSGLPGCHYDEVRGIEYPDHEMHRKRLANVGGAGAAQGVFRGRV